MATKRPVGRPPVVATPEVEPKTVRQPAMQVLQEFLVEKGIEVTAKPLANIKTVSDGSMIVGIPQILVSYNNEPRR